MPTPQINEVTRIKVLKTLARRKEFIPNCIFDVGANVGQSVSDFRNIYPQATIYAFEPINLTFVSLAKKWGDDPKVQCHKIGLSNRTGTAQMLSVGTKKGNRIPLSSQDAGKSPTEKVRLISGDDFCERNGVHRIDFLKIDAEGHDLAVIAGFAKMLVSGRIKFVQVEVGLAPDNFSHVPYERVASTLFAFGFRLFGFFSFSHRMRRYKMRSEGVYFADAVFVYDQIGSGQS
jgi:FkbM family methyltransferase